MSNPLGPQTSATAFSSLNQYFSMELTGEIWCYLSRFRNTVPSFFLLCQGNFPQIVGFISPKEKQSCSAILLALPLLHILNRSIVTG